eukprot:TRINITY_DN13976_c1_g1_i5.p1 TRINITY_DN13976_c1_g1~~TRINITY_DN13976_c1_g1_i5.p1  ORF type:complete len:272 (-),score=42.26 TRINITY_DN13976_c1_g1_i5:270-1085(-)
MAMHWPVAAPAVLARPLIIHQAAQVPYTAAPLGPVTVVHPSKQSCFPGFFCQPAPVVAATPRIQEQALPPLHLQPQVQPQPQPCSRPQQHLQPTVLRAPLPLSPPAASLVAAPAPSPWTSSSGASPCSISSGSAVASALPMTLPLVPDSSPKQEQATTSAPTAILSSSAPPVGSLTPMAAPAPSILLSPSFLSPSSSTVNGLSLGVQSRPPAASVVPVAAPPPSILLLSALPSNEPTEAHKEALPTMAAAPKPAKKAKKARKAKNAKRVCC